MNKQLVIGGLVLWFVAQGGIAFGETIIGSEYFPLKEGYSWTYQETDPVGTYIETETVLPGTKIVNGYETKIVAISTGEYTYATSDLNGVRIHGFHFPPEDFVYFNPPIVLLKGTRLGVSARW